MGTLLQRYKKHQTQNEKSNPAIFQCGFQKAAISREAGKVVIGIILKAVRACGHWATANRMRMNIRLNARAVGIAHFVRIILIKIKGGRPQALRKWPCACRSMTCPATQTARLLKKVPSCALSALSEW